MGSTSWFRPGLGFGILFLVLSCSKSEIGIRTHHDSIPGWRGVYLTSSERLESFYGKGFVEAMFMGNGVLQFHVKDKSFDRFLWITRTKVVSSNGRELSIACESAAIFDDAIDGSMRLVYHKTSGKGGEYRGPEEGRSEVTRFQSESQILSKEFPDTLARCDGTTISLQRALNDRAETRITLVDGNNRYEFAPSESESFVGLARESRRSVGNYKFWAAGRALPHFSSSLVLEDKVNGYLPAPQTHSFFILPKFIIEKGQSLGSSAELLIRWTRARRLNLKETHVVLSPFAYNQLERGRWVEATPQKARVYRGQGREGVKLDLVWEGDFPVGDEENKHFLVLGQKSDLQGGTMNFQIELLYENLVADRTSLWQSIRFAADAEGIVTSVGEYEYK